MTQQQTPPDGGDNGSTPTEIQKPDLGKRPISDFPAEIQEYIRDLRRENRKAHDDRKSAEQKRQQEEQARLEADKQWETLAGQYKKQLDELTPRAERVDTVDQLLKDMAQTRITGLPKQFQKLVPEYDDPLKTLAWLDANASTLSAPVPPNLDAGLQGDGGNPNTAVAKLSADELTLAQQAGMTPEQFATYKARRKPADAK